MIISDDFLYSIVNHCNNDIRSSINNLQVKLYYCMLFSFIVLEMNLKILN